MKKIIFALLLIIIGWSAGFYSCTPYRQWQKERQHRARFLNKPAPAFETTTVDGSSWRLSDARGKVVLIDFWATWCPDCRVAIPTMKKIYGQYGGRDDFMMVGVSLDAEQEPLKKMTAEQGMTWLQLFEEGKKWDNSVSEKYGIFWIPSVWVVDKEGITRGLNLHDEDSFKRRDVGIFDSEGNLVWHVFDRDEPSGDHAMARGGVILNYTMPGRQTAYILGTGAYSIPSAVNKYPVYDRAGNPLGEIQTEGPDNGPVFQYAVCKSVWINQAVAARARLAEHEEPPEGPEGPPIVSEVERVQKF